MWSHPSEWNHPIGDYYTFLKVVRLSTEESYSTAYLKLTTYKCNRIIQSKSDVRQWLSKVH